MAIDREAVLSFLRAHSAADPQERADLQHMVAAVQGLPQPFARSQQDAHFTASAVVTDPAGERVCLIHHCKLQRWLQPGGHLEADDGSVAAAALREVLEETGLTAALHPTAPCPLDVDVHDIPERKTEAAHQHLDIRFLVVADHPEGLAPDPAESSAAKWLSWDEALALADEPALRRLMLKAQSVSRLQG